MATSLPGCSWLGRQDGPVATLPVDIHCHLFNAADLPVHGFVEHVVLGDHKRAQFPLSEPTEAGGVLKELVLLLIDILRSGAITAADESRDLDQAQPLERMDADDGDSPADRERDRQILRGLLQQRYGAVTESTESGPASPLLREMQKEAAPAPMIRGPEESLWDLASSLYFSTGFVYRNLQWAFLLTRSRRQITNRYRRLYRESAGFKLMTPALIDYSRWLQDEPASTLLDQIEVFDRIQRLSRDIRIHSFMAYDPWRQIMPVAAPQTLTSLELCQLAIREKGFAGIKLYPPMGFRATGNTELEPDAFPERARAIPRFAAKLDTAMEELFIWCVSEDVPVMAHAAPTNQAGDYYALRADPKWWDAVLSKPKFRNLRLNLAHFGGFETAHTAEGIAVEKSWEWKIGAMIRDGRYPNLYADLSYLSEFLGANSTTREREALTGAMRTFVRTFDPEVMHLMYGSDWIMLGREPEHGRMPEKMLRLVSDIGLSKAQSDRFFGGNALRFLGLSEPGRARDRLSDYYARHGLPFTFPV